MKADIPLHEEGLVDGIHPLLGKRFSPRAFDDRPIDQDVLRRILNAARWAASCNNEQPWRFAVGIKGNGANIRNIILDFLNILTSSPGPFSYQRRGAEKCNTGLLYFKLVPLV